MITKEEFGKKLDELVNEAHESKIREIDISTFLVSANIATIIIAHERAKADGAI